MSSSGEICTFDGHGRYVGDGKCKSRTFIFFKGGVFLAIF